MTHPAPDLLALVALGEDAEPGLREHVAECPDCLDEVEGLQQAVAVGRSLGPEDELVAPHPRVWQGIEQALVEGRVTPEAHPVLSSSEQRDEPATVSSISGSTARSEGFGATRHHRRSPSGAGRDRRRWAIPVLAAAAALVIGLGGGFVLKNQLDPAPQAAGVTQLNALPQWPGANGTASIEKGPDGQRTLVITVEVPKSDRVDGTFEVWMSDSRATDMLPMGSMPGPSGRFPIPPTVDLAAHPVVDVSLEPPGDTDPGHSGTSVVRGRVVR